MPTQKFTKQDIDQLSAWFQRRNEAQFAWKSAISAYMALPGLRGFWPMSQVAYTNPQGLDASGNANHLTNNNTVTFGYSNLIPQATFDSTNYLSKADGGVGNWADILATEAYIEIGDKGLTCYAWVRFDGVAAAGEHIISKWLSTGNLRAYRLRRDAGGNLEGQVSTDGTATVTAVSTDVLAATTWYFTAMQFDPSTEISVWVNNVKDSTVAAIPASIFDTSDIFALGAVNNGTLQRLSGRLSMVALCAAFHSDTIVRTTFEQSRALFGVK